MVDDLLLIFGEEAQQCLADLVRLALEAQVDPSRSTDPETVGAMFRAAHTLKGSAGMVGVPEVQRVAHAMEDLLDEVRAGTRSLTGPVIDELLVGADGISAMLPDMVAGRAIADGADALVARLRAFATGAPLPPAAPAAGGAPPAPVLPVAPPLEPLPPVAEPAALAGAPVAATESDGDAIRVPVARIDHLARLVGEVAAANLRLSQLLGEQLGTDPSAIPEVLEATRRIGELHDVTMRTRMVPLSTITDRLHRAIRDAARTTGKLVRFEVRGVDTELDRTMLDQLADPLLHLVRNAVDHGIESPAERRAAGKDDHGTVRLHAMQLGSEVIVAVADDGAGIDTVAVQTAAGIEPGDADADALALVFRPGLSTADTVSELSGRGVGLDVVQARLDAVRGRVDVRSEAGAGTEFRLAVPITLAVLPCLIVRSGAQDLGIPMHSVERLLETLPTPGADGRAHVWIDEAPISCSSLDRVLLTATPAARQVVVVADLARRHAFAVGEIVGLRDVVVTALSPVLPRIPAVAGVSVLADGAILTIVDVPGLIDRAERRPGTMAGGPAEPEFASTPSAAPAGAAGPAGRVRARILVVDDAATVRELQRSILQRAGFAVVTADDGVDGLARLAEGGIDLVVTDVEMPRMNGFELTEAIRSLDTRSNTPVVILTSRAGDEDRVRGMRAGADGYLVKSSFSEATLLAAVERLLGR